MPSNNVFQYGKIRTRKQSAKKPEKKWNPPLFGIRNPLRWNPESGIHSMESRIQDCPGFPYMGRPTVTRENVLTIRTVMNHLINVSEK